MGHLHAILAEPYEVALQVGCHRTLRDAASGRAGQLSRQRAALTLEFTAEPREPVCRPSSKHVEVRINRTFHRRLPGVADTFCDPPSQEMLIRSCPQGWFQVEAQRRYVEQRRLTMMSERFEHGRRWRSPRL
jgi:hypothetical protein